MSRARSRPRLFIPPTERRRLRKRWIPWLVGSGLLWFLSCANVYPLLCIGLTGERDVLTDDPLEDVVALVAMLIPAAVFASLLIAYATRVEPKHRRAYKGLCWGCGYDVQAGHRPSKAAELACPECGAVSNTRLPHRTSDTLAYAVAETLRPSRDDDGSP